MATAQVVPTNIHALRQRAAEVRGAMSLLLDTCEKERRDMTDEEASIFAARKDDFDKIAARIAVAEGRMDRERGSANLQPVEDYDAAGIRRIANGFQRSAGTVKGGRKISEMFGSSALANDGWSSPDEFYRVLHTGVNDARLKPASMMAAMNESQPVGGGFFVPTDLVAQLLDASLENEIVRPRAQIEPMRFDTKKIVGFDASDSTNGNLYGGITATWAAELAAGTDQQPKVRLIQLTANKLLILIPISNEMLADGGANFEELLSGAIIKACSWHLDDAFLNGNGAGKPAGVLSNPALIAVAKESTQPASTIVYANIAKMVGSMHPACFGNSVWIINPTCLPQLLQMTLNVQNVAGTENVGGSATPILSQDGDTFRMLTRPVLFTEKLPTVGTQGDIVLADLSQYVVGMRLDMMLEKSAHVGFTSDQTYYRCVVRVDGQGKWKSYYKPKNGTGTSWSVALAAR